MAVLQKVKINNEWVPVSGSNVNSGGGGSIEVDHKVSDSSTNAVSSKAVKAYIDSFIPSEFNSDFSDDFTN